MLPLRQVQMGAISRAVGFYVICLGLCLALSGVSARLGEATLLLAMATPTLAALAMLVLTGEGLGRKSWNSLGLLRSGLGHWPLAIGAPIAVLLISYSITWGSGLGNIVPPDGSAGLPAMAFRLVAGLCVGLVFAMGEELGWRGYLLPQLVARLAPLPAMLAVGFLHGVWHLPLLLGTPYYHSAGEPLFVVPLFLATLTIAGTVFGYLRLASVSVWPAAIAHAMWNLTWGILSEVTAGDPRTLEYAAGESGVIPLAVLTSLAYFLSRRIVGRADYARAP